MNKRSDQFDETFLAKAKATALQVARSMPEPNRLWELLESFPVPNSRELERAFIAEVQADPDRKLGWVQALEQTCADAAANLADDSLGSFGEERLKSAILSWQREQDPLAVWSRHAEAPLRGGAMQKARILLGMDIAAGLRAVEKMPYPGVIENTLFWYIEDEPESIVPIFRAAPLVFEDDGSWVKDRRVAALVVTDLVVNHAKLRHVKIEVDLRSWSEGERRQAQQRVPGLRAELAVWMKCAFEALVERPDGLHIAIAYMAILIRRIPNERAHKYYQTDPWLASEAALEVLTSILRDRGIGISKARDLWAAAEGRAKAANAVALSRNRVRKPSNRQSAHAGEGARTLYGKGWSVFTASLRLVPKEPRQDELELVASWLEGVLVGRDPELDCFSSLVREGTSNACRTLGRLLSLVPNPEQRLETIYKKLEPQRRRGLLPCRYEASNDIESIILLRIGLDSAAHWAYRLREGGKLVEPAQKLSLWIYEQARRLWLTASVEPAGTKRQLVGGCFAFMPTIWGESLHLALKSTIVPIANDSCILVDACINLSKNGVAVDELTTIVSQAGADLESALRDFLEVWEMSGRAEPLSADIKSFACELGITITEDERDSRPRLPRLREHGRG